MAKPSRSQQTLATPRLCGFKPLWGVNLWRARGTATAPVSCAFFLAENRKTGSVGNLPRKSPSQWAQIRAEYERGGSLRSLANRHELSHTAVAKKAKAEGWQRAPAADDDLKLLEIDELKLLEIDDLFAAP